MNRKDLLQQVLLAIWKSIPAFRGQAKPTTYLYSLLIPSWFPGL